MRFNRLFSFLIALTVVLSPIASASLLTIAPTTLEATLAPGSTWNVTGTITNLTSLDLLTTELFLDFSGYPFGALTPRQTLGGVAFSIADRTVSDMTDLFSIDLASDAISGTSYSFDVFAMDVNGNFSNVSTFTLLVDAPPVSVPEPPALLLMRAGLLALLALTASKYVPPVYGAPA